MALLDLAGRVAEAIPNTRAATVLVDGALDLVGRGGDTQPQGLGLTREIVAAQLHGGVGAATVARFGAFGSALF
jgi:hypothetical protein